MIEQKVLNEIAALLKGSLVKQLEIPRRSTTYGGPGKPGLPNQFQENTQHQYHHQ